MIIMSPIYSGDIVFARVVCSSLLKEFEIIATMVTRLGVHAPLVGYKRH